MRTVTTAARLWLVTLLTAALASTAACMGSAQVDPSPPPASGPSIINVGVYGPAPVISAYTTMAAKLGRLNPDVVVNIHPFADYRDLAENLAEPVAGEQQPPSLDVFVAPRPEIAQLVEAEKITPVGKLLTAREVDFGDGVQRDALAALSLNADLQCLPIDLSPLVVYYNTNLINLAELTPAGEAPINSLTGWKLPQFLLAARRAIRPGVKGFYIAPELDQLAPFIYSGGGQVVDDILSPTQLTLADGPSEEALSELFEILQRRRLTPSVQQLEKRSALSRFKAGDLAMILGYRELTPQLRQQENLSFDVMPLPRLSSRATSGKLTGLCINADSTQVDAAADFLAYAISSEASQLLAASGYITPTNLDVANSDSFRQPALQPQSADVFTSTIRYVRWAPTHPAWELVSQEAKQVFAEMIEQRAGDQLSEYLAGIDAASVPLFTPIPQPTDATEPHNPQQP